MPIKRLTFLEHYRIKPVVSPDGTRIAFSTFSDIYIMKLDGSGLTKLTCIDMPWLSPSFSPDGSQMVFPDGSSYYEGDDEFDISIFNLDTFSKQQLTDTGHDIDPAFSPDGNVVVYVSRIDGAYNICRIRRETSDIMRLTYTKSKGHTIKNTNQVPAFTPDGKWIFYLSSAHNKGMHHSPEVYRMGPYGEDQKRLTFTKGTVYDYLISPDGSHVVFATCNEERIPGRPAIDIWVMNIDGTNQRLLEEGTSVSFLGSISPDGKWLAISSSRDQIVLSGGNLCWRIYLINTDSGEVRRLTEDLSNDQYPRFTPGGKQIVFWSNRDGKGDLYLLTDFL